MTATYPASPKMINFIKRLVAERDLSGLTEAQRESLNTPEELNWRQAKIVISTLLELDKIAPQRSSAPELEPGMYRKDGTIYKVQIAVHGSGRPYAKKLVQDEGEWTFEFAPGMVHRLTEADAMTLDEAKEFGALYGTCCVCGRTLTKEESIEAGIGPICATKF